MNWIHFLWPMVTGACITLGLINLRIGFVEKPRAARLLFSLSCFAVALVSAMELAMMRADTPARYEVFLGWGNFAAWLALSSLTAFIWTFFRAGNKWLALAGPAVYGAGLLYDLVSEPSLVYLRVTGLKTLQTYGGATYQVAEGVPNPWNVLAYIGVLLMLGFAVDASRGLWRTGLRRRTIIVGASLVFFIVAAGIHSGLIERGVIHSPYLISWFYLAILIAMGHELTKDVFAATRLGRELRESEVRFRSVTDAAPVMIWMSGADRSCNFFNKGWLEYTGRSLEQERGDGWTASVHVEDAAHCHEVYEAAFARKEAFTTEFRLRRHDGEYRWMLDTGTPRFDGNAAFLGYIGSCIDIADRKQAELDHQLQSMELARVGRLALMGELATSLAHEVNNPLGAMVTNASAGQRMLAHGELGAQELQELLGDIVADGHRAREVINGIRNMARKTDVSQMPIAIEDIIRDLLRIVRADAVARNVTLAAEVDDKAGVVLGDRVQLLQVLLNLTLNAFEALITTQTVAARVLIRAERGGDGRVCIEVCDSGPGLSAERVEQLFEPFFSTKTEGTGMGLAIARTIVEAHGGTLSARNAEDGGAIFSVSLPEIAIAKPQAA